MKLKLALAVLMVALLATVTFTACPGDAEDRVEITLVNNKVEIDAALRAFAALYERETGVRVNVLSFGGEVPYAPAISAMFAAGTEPEIFVFEGWAGYDDARRGGRITYLDNEPWLADTDLAYISPTTGGIVGFPVAIEGWGLGYNREILRRAGVDPASMTNIAGMRAAFERIHSMRGELGLDAVVSMAAGPGMTWVTGLHAMNAYLTLGLPYYDSTRYIDMLNRGEVDPARLRYFAEYMDLLFRHSIPASLVVGGYDTQLGDFAIQRTAFIHQGNWIDPTFAEMGINFEMGYVPHAFLPETTDGIFIGAPSFYIVNARAENIQAAKDFLTFMASTPAGHRYMVTEAGAVAAFRSVTLQPPGQFSRAVQEWAGRGSAHMFAWQQNEMPAGFGMDVLGPIFLLLASGEINVDGFVQMFTDAVATLR
ncbi:MAG: ABC transporter substrate-binding protein [Treponema sp.]|nr:ABC transporter substrate-binding protein [Treponema sp.]